MRYDYPIQVPIMVTSSEQLCAVYAILANPNLSGEVNVGMEVRKQQYDVKVVDEPADREEARKLAAKQTLENVGNAVRTANPNIGQTFAPKPQEATGASRSDEAVEVDSEGSPFDESIHTGTKTKDGRWRMKKGAVRPEPANPSPTTGSTSTGNDGEETSSESGAAANENAGNSGTDEEDEFAAFREAAAETSEPVQVPERTWTDADLGQLCNDAAVKLNDPAPVRALIAKFVPEGDVPHSRNIPNANREAFAQAIEETAGIEYAG